MPQISSLIEQIEQAGYRFIPKDKGDRVVRINLGEYMDRVSIHGATLDGDVRRPIAYFFKGKETDERPPTRLGQTAVSYTDIMYDIKHFKPDLILVETSEGVAALDC